MAQIKINQLPEEGQVALTEFTKDLSKIDRVEAIQGGESSLFIGKFGFHKDSFCLRIAKNQANQDDLRKETYYLAEVAKLQIAPSIHYISPDSRVTISRFITGHCLTLQEANVFSTLEKVVNLIKLLQSVQPIGIQKPFLYSTKNHLKTLDENIEQLPGYYAELYKICKPSFLDFFKKINNSIKACVVHGDLDFGNILIQHNNQKLWIIDWESVIISDSYLDLASLSLNFRLSQTSDLKMLTAYFSRVPSIDEKERFELIKNCLLFAHSVYFMDKALNYMANNPLIKWDEGLDQKMRTSEKDMDYQAKYQNINNYDISTSYRKDTVLILQEAATRGLMDLSQIWE